MFCKNTYQPERGVRGEIEREGRHSKKLYGKHKHIAPLVATLRVVDAVRCSVLQCNVVCCGELKELHEKHKYIGLRVAMLRVVVAACYNVLQSVAMCCSLLG